jgi:hypothetical protein
MAKLAAYAAELRSDGREVPDFDPLDGGVHARVLFLLEKPGPMTAESGIRIGSGFISRDNDDPTADAIFNFMRQAAIPRDVTAIWNVIPWWNGTRKVTAGELREGASCVKTLITLFPALSAIVMVGEKAARARGYLENTKLAIITSSHPSPIVRARFRAKWDAIPVQWAKVMTII